MREAAGVTPIFYGEGKAVQRLEAVSARQEGRREKEASSPVLLFDPLQSAVASCISTITALGRSFIMSFSSMPGRFLHHQTF